MLHIIGYFFENCENYSLCTNCINAVHQLFVHGNPPFISVPLNYKCMFNCSSASAVVVHCRVSPILCVHGHREMVTRRLYLDQSFIPPQPPLCFIFHRFPPRSFKTSCPRRGARRSLRVAFPPAFRSPPRGLRS